jgi:hypothetical protein
LVQHHTIPGSIATYQADALAAYDLIRAGKVKTLASSKVGDLGATIVEYLSVNGFMYTSEIVNALNSSLPEDEQVSLSKDSC